MFTGIIEEIGTVKSVMRRPKGARIEIAAKTVLEGTRLGDSIATNGVCLTVVERTDDHFTADVMAQTLRLSNLGTFKSGDPVNLERAMALGGRLGGHLVAGHCDGVAKILSLREEGDALWIELKLPEKLMRYCLDQGSIALDGTSLTIAAKNGDRLAVSLIPMTQEETILAQKRVGDPVNIEVDMIGKFVEQLLPGARQKNLTMATLAEHGFL